MVIKIYGYESLHFVQRNAGQVGQILNICAS